MVLPEDCDKNDPRLATVDHYIPISRGGFNQVYNKVIACEPCNLYKGNLLPEEFAFVLFSNGKNIDWYYSALSLSEIKILDLTCNPMPGKKHWKRLCNEHGKPRIV